jgi:hypothetical protein
MNKLITNLFLFILAMTTIACERSTSDVSSVKFKTPNRYEIMNQKGLTSFATPSTGKLCYGISVTGPGLPVSSFCGEQTGSVAGFVAEGQELSIDLPKGSDRKFSLYAYFVDQSEQCPDWGAPASDLSQWGSIYSAGSVAGVNLVNDTETVTIDYNLATSSVGDQSSLTQCKGSSYPGGGQLYSMLLSNGDVIASNLEKFANDHSNPTWESLSMVISGNQNLWVYLTNAFEYFFESDSGAVGSSTTTYGAVNLPAYIRSLTQKPDSLGRYFGLLEDGKVVEVDEQTGVASVPSACPFSTCQVPVWIQSISAGKGTKLYGLDHAGNLYEITSTGLVDIVTLSPAVVQVSFY